MTQIIPKVVKFECPGGDCKKALIGLPRLRPFEYRRLKQREKRVNRAYGGSRCASCVRSRHMDRFRPVWYMLIGLSFGEMMNIYIYYTHVLIYLICICIITNGFAEKFPLQALVSAVSLHI